MMARSANRVSPADPAKNMSPPVTRNPQQIHKFAEYFKSVENLKAFNFAGNDSKFPPTNSAFAADAFFFSCLNQFGFWHMEDGKWSGSMRATLNGEELKGSDYLFACVKRAWDEDPEVFRPASIARMRPARLSQIFFSDQGTNPLPMWEEHAHLSLAYGRWMHDSSLTPELLLDQANQSEYPLQTFLDQLALIPGYKEDPLRKKAMLLAIIMENRPEQFLRVRDPQSAIPIIDYHLQRSALRTGLVTINDPMERQNIVQRVNTPSHLENSIRHETFAALEELTALSGKSVASIDWFFFQNRHRCPETTTPDCPNCPVQHICVKQTDLFQPVLRTTFY
jgi:hypothetical protein